jgi:hypothetical protein
LKLELFRSRRFSAAIAALALGLFPLVGALFVVTQTLQFDLGFSPLQAGVRILPMAGSRRRRCTRSPARSAARSRSRPRSAAPVAGCSRTPRGRRS